jgi:hypothetical protein
MSTKSKLLSIGLGFMASYEYMREERKSQILQKWEESKKLPRKKKKQLRKELNIDWQLANFDVFSCL